jgi:hypothetical protein
MSHSKGSFALTLSAAVATAGGSGSPPALLGWVALGLAAVVAVVIVMVRRARRRAARAARQADAPPPPGWETPASSRHTAWPGYGAYRQGPADTSRRGAHRAESRSYGPGPGHGGAHR